MTEPLRRRVRARLLAGCTTASAWLPSPLRRLGIGALTEVALQTRYAQLALNNLEHAARVSPALPQTEAQRKRLVRRVFKHSARNVDEWMRLARGASDVNGRWIEDTVQLDDSARILADEWKAGRGVIVVTAHIGNWELLAARLRRVGYDGAVIGLEKRKDSSAQWLIDMRAAYDVRTVSQDSSPRDLLRILQQGGMLGILPDLEVRRLDGEFLPFFGRDALTMTAPAALARARGVPLIPVSCTLAADGSHYDLRVEEPLAFDRGLDRRAATTELTSRLNAVFERWIEAQPEQWVWHQDRWRTRPGDYDAVPLVERHRINAAKRSK